MPVRTILMRAMQVMVDMVMDLLDRNHRIVREAASILELEGKETLTVAAINTGARLVCRDGKDGDNQCIQPLPGAEPRALRLIKVHSMHELDGRDASAGCYGVGLNTLAPLPRSRRRQCILGGM